MPISPAGSSHHKPLSRLRERGWGEGFWKGADLHSALSPNPSPASGRGEQNRQCGFTYPVVLAIAVVLGILAGVASEATSRVNRLDREAELLFRGQQYRAAIRSYYEAERPKMYPRALEDLMKDPRSPSRHHLRALYPDPMAKDAQQGWRLIRAGDGGISGVASSSADEPIRKTHFARGLESLEGAMSYSEWAFEHQPQRDAVHTRAE